jgi:S1-C subfamily serine protease
MSSLAVVASLPTRSERRVASKRGGGGGRNSSRSRHASVRAFHHRSDPEKGSNSVPECSTAAFEHFEGNENARRKLSRRGMAIAGVSAALAGTQLVPTPPAANALVDEANAVKVFEKTKQSIVALAEYTDGGVNGGYASKGTGVVWASFHEGGFVVTSFHVVKEFVNGAPSGGAGKEKKKKNDGSSTKILRVNVPQTNGAGGDWHDAIVVGTQRASDIAVLRLMRPVVLGEDEGVMGVTSNSSKQGVTLNSSNSSSSKTFKPLLAAPLGDSETLKVGQTLYVLGGMDAQTTMSAGVVSGLRRSIPSKNGTTIRNVIQTDAEITEQNVGGAVVDSDGRLIGLATTTYGQPQAGLGFAVPTDDLLKIVPALITLHQIS